MIVAQQEFREALRRVVKGAIVIAALTFLMMILNSIRATEPYFSGMSIRSWIQTVYALIIVGVLITLFKPARTVVTFYLAAMLKVGTVPGRERHAGSVAAMADKLTLLLVVLISYACLDPVVTKLNTAFLHANSVVTCFNAIVILGAIVIVLALWTRAQPLVDELSGHIADKVAPQAKGNAPTVCSKCGAKNEPDDAFCAVCGESMKAPPPPPAPTIKGGCPKCAAVNPPDSKFCYQCGCPLS